MIGLLLAHNHPEISYDCNPGCAATPLHGAGMSRLVLQEMLLV
jgi:hypothetical protein